MFLLTFFLIYGPFLVLELSMAYPSNDSLRQNIEATPARQSSQSDIYKTLTVVFWHRVSGDEQENQQMKARLWTQDEQVFPLTGTSVHESIDRSGAFQATFDFSTTRVSEQRAAAEIQRLLRVYNLHQEKEGSILFEVIAVDSDGRMTGSRRCYELILRIKKFSIEEFLGGLWTHTTKDDIVECPARFAFV